MDDIVEPSGPPRPRRQDAIIEAFGENAPSTQNGAASEAARDNDEPNRPPCQRQVTQTPEVSAVDTLRTRPASGTGVRLAYVPDGDYGRRTITDSARYLKAMRDKGGWSKGLLGGASLPAIAERDEHYRLVTPYGQRIIHRKRGEVLHPRLLPASELERLRRSMTEHIFAAQFQQDPQPPAGLIVKREWLTFYCEKDKPDCFDQIVQSWDTASKTSELSDYSVCTTWGVKDRKMYLLNVFRRRMEFPELKRQVRELSSLWRASIVLIEDKSSGTQLIQELRADGFAQVQAAPNNDDKVMRLRAQTAKIEGHFVLFPDKAHNAKHDDQVDSTVHALAWLTQEATRPGMALYWLTKMNYEKRMQELEGKG